ncbi:oxidoreductase domain protein [Novosphingobium sp. Rr 2-17]|uniref:Gfo/Idh/MocA family protein n=1 Tax=Novosphingobium sp. Rr 2-17 TaxID=555793 RepID=UPI00026984CA|nr:Gfo/Idh/MocA family oxidoreductase [Novosphingobium sp. Rr 2-17]EIZ80513.1 oxidoreductase domain protein [Novosphingobium sp. Rr 2-17]
MPETSPIGLAVIGCGRISAAHFAAAQALPQDIRVVATVDRDIAQARAAAVPFGAQAFDTAEQALALPEVEAVLIATPNALHAAQSLAALRAGKHVLVEKPVAETGAEAVELAREAEARSLVLAAGHTFRHNAAVRYITDNWASFGTLRAVEVSSCVHWDGPQAPWWAERSAEDGLILSLFAPHSLDFVQLMMGADDPVRVHAEAARHQSGWQGEDEAMIVMAYPGRRLASVHISYNQPSVLDRKVLHFDKGVLEIEHGEILRWNGDVLVEPEEGVIIDPRVMGGRKLGHFFRDQLSEFAAAVCGQAHRCPTGYDAARLITLIDRVKASARANSAADAIDPPPPGQSA